MVIYSPSTATHIQFSTCVVAMVAVDYVPRVELCRLSTTTIKG
jgi:hypothetical protein